MSLKMVRPHKQAVKASVRRAKELLNKLSAAAADDAAAKQAVAHAVGESRRSSVFAELALLDVEMLNADKQGIRVSALRNAGIRNLAQISGMSVGRMTSINGIGEASAHKIKRIADEICRAVAVSAKININPQKRTSQQDELLHNLFVMRHGKPLRAQAQGLLSREPHLAASLRAAEPAASSLKWMFSSGAKKKASLEAYHYLSGLIDDEFGNKAAQCLTAYQNIMRPSTEECYADFVANAAAYYTLLENLGASVSAAAPAKGLPEELVAEIEQYPLDLSHMKTELRCYQTFGAKYILRQEKVLLGDEMGLGKTIQALTVIADLKANGATHFLVVCPAGVMVNWKRETDKHTDIPSIIIHGGDKEEELEQWQAEGGVGITNYESVLKLADSVDFPYGVLVVDEAHYVKNPEAKRTQALLAVAERTRRILYMTGTPLENRVDEMCFLVGCLRPDIAERLSSMKTLSATQKFKNELAPVYLRRIRHDVLAELPDLIENADWLEPTQEERAAYSAAVQSGNFMAMRRVSWDRGTDASSKAQRLMEICDEAQREGRKVIVFSFFRDTLQKVCEMLKERAVGPITGGVSTAGRQELLDDFASAEQGQVLVAQVQAGGVGLNIQSASVVIFCEPQIKPSLETQAISRAYRMGQIRNVHVHRLLCEGTVDELVMEMLQTKQGEFDTYAEESVVGAESLKEQANYAWIKKLIAREKARLNP